MVRYLSAAWLDAAVAAFERHHARPGGDLDAVVIEQVVTGTPDGDVTYHLRLGTDGARFGRGSAADATVVFTEDYDTAAAINRGELSAQGAFMSGRIRVRGDLSRLARAGEGFAELEDVLAEVRADTPATAA
jgi:hypothetical protein